MFGLPEVALGSSRAGVAPSGSCGLLGPARGQGADPAARADRRADALRLGSLTEVVGDGERSSARSSWPAARPASHAWPSTYHATRRSTPCRVSRTAGLALERLAYGMLAQTDEASTPCRSGGGHECAAIPDRRAARDPGACAATSPRARSGRSRWRSTRPTSRSPWDLWRKAAELGLTSFMLPEEYGGGGHDRLPDRAASCRRSCRGAARASAT